MYPTLKENDIVLVNRLSYVFNSPKAKDIIVLRDPRTGREVIKRITKVQGGTYFVEGDNKKESTDSRVYGAIKRSAIIGKVLSLS